MSTKRRRTPMGDADEKASTHLLVGLGVGIITTVTGLSVAGTYTAINAMNRQSEQALAAAKEVAGTKNDSSAEVTEPPVVTPEPTETSEPEWTSDQIKWMQENHITYDEYGLPEDENGNLVDDPTTEDVYDPSRIAYFFEDDGTPKKPYLEDLPGEDGEVPSDPLEDPVENPDVEQVPTEETDPVEAPSVENPAPSVWWLDEDGNLLPGLKLDEDGKPYYVVQKGDWLSRIGSKYGFSYKDLAEVSDIKNPNLIYEGDVIYFPDKEAETAVDEAAVNVTTGSQAPGRG